MLPVWPFYRYLMVLLYLAFGVYLMAAKEFAVLFDTWQRILFGVVLVGYGLYRFAIIKKQQRDD